MQGPRRHFFAFVATGIALAALGVAGCGSDSSGDAVLTVYVSAPLNGPDAADGHDIADGAEAALQDAGGEAGGTEVKLEVLDDAGPAGATDALAGANARRATEDSTAIAYVGELDSGTTRTSLPITNQAGLLQVSPGASAVDLTRAAPGSDQIPDAVQPSGTRTFGRVIPSDTAQGAAAATAAADSGVGSVVAFDSKTAYGTALVDGFSSVADAPSVVPPDFSGGADGIYVVSPRRAPVLDAGRETAVLAADAQIAGEPPETTMPKGATLISGAMAPGQLPGGDVEGGGGRYAAYGYEATAVVLDSIDRADDPLDRGSVVDAFFATTDRDSVLGSYSIDEVGDTTLSKVGVYEARADGRLRAAGQPISVP